MAKFNANGLSYSQNLPPFLAALRGQYGSENGDGPDPILAAQRRPAKKRSASEEAEDAPLVLDDRGDVVAGVTFGKDGTAKAVPGEADRDVDDEAAGGEGDGQPDAAVAGVGIGPGKKRRAGKVVGGASKDDNGDDGAVDRRKRKRTDGDDTKRSSNGATADKPPLHGPAKRNVDAKGKAGTAPGKDADKAGAPKKKKKAKIQLSFEDDEEEG